MTIIALETRLAQITAEINAIHGERCRNASAHVRWANLGKDKEWISAQLWNARLAQIKRRNPLKTFIINLGQKWSAQRDAKLWELAGDK